MDNIKDAARDLGKLIQKNEKYINYSIAMQTFEANMELQEKINKFEETRNELTREAQKEDKDAEKLKELDKTVREMFAEISESSELKALNEAQQDLQKILGGINQIVQGSASGLDPENIDFEVSCGGSCESCSGC